MSIGKKGSINELIGGTMSGSLTPRNPIVKMGSILNLVVRDSGGELTYRHFIAAQDFDYRETLELVRKEQIFKTEDVFARFSELLVKHKLVFETDAMLIDLGVRGRVSEAVMSVYKDVLNDSATLVDDLIARIERSCFTFAGPEGDLHVMKIDRGRTLGYVKVSISCDRHVERWTTLDIAGPPGADFPVNLQQSIEARLTAFISERQPDDYLALRAYVGRSELAQSEDSLLEVYS